MPIRQFKVTVNGSDYEVLVQEVTPGAVPAPLAAVVAPMEMSAQPAPASRPTAAPAATSNGAHAGIDEVAHMGGVVVAVDVTVGQTVVQGDRLLVLEAMKMKTHLLASRAGKITRIMVAAGEAVEGGQPLISIE